MTKLHINSLFKAFSPRGAACQAAGHGPDTATLQPAQLRLRAARPGWLAAVLGLLLAPAGLVAAEPPRVLAQVKEFINQQYAGTALLLRLEAFETEFQSRVYDPENSLLRASGVAGMRLGPVFQFIEPASKTRQIRIEVTYGRRTSRSNVDLQMQKFEPDGPDSSRLTQAYRLLSFGQELAEPGRRDVWTMKVSALVQAAEIFSYLGMQELQLWSAYYAHHFMLTQLADPVTAAEGAQEIQLMARRIKRQTIELAALQLEASAVDAQARKAQGNPQLRQRAQTLFEQAAALANSMDLQFERARAVYQSGLAHEQAGDIEQAFSRFDEVLQIADASGDIELANEVRKHAAELHESRGNNARAIELMRQISSADNPAAAAAPEPAPLVEDPPAGDQRAGRDMARYLFEQGRLLEKTYRHEAAIPPLLQAVQLDAEFPSPSLTGPAALLLAQAYFGQGQWDEAGRILPDAIIKTPARGNETTLFEAHEILAVLLRQRAEFDALRAARARQAMFATTPGRQARLTYEQALDAFAQDGNGSGNGRSLLRKSEQLASEAQDETIQALAALQQCALLEAADCAGGRGQQLASRLAATGVPARSLEGQLLWAKVQSRLGLQRDALDTLDSLIDEIHFYQTAVPGVLGAWYWQNRERVATLYMDALLDQGVQTSGATAGPAQALRTLAALDELRRVARQSATSQQDDASQTAASDRFRSALASREEAGSERQRAEYSQQLDAAVSTLRNQRHSRGQDRDASPSLEQLLGRLSANEAVLTYYFSARHAWVWVAGRQRHEQIRLKLDQAARDALSDDLEQLRIQAAAAGSSIEQLNGLLERLGRQLIAPVAPLLPERIYFVPAGRTEGLPLDALRHGGDYLATRHEVINLLSLDALAHKDRRIDPGRLAAMFLAGNRQQDSGDFSTLTPPSSEIRQIADVFIGPRLHIIQGAALQRDEFEDARLRQAELIHLAMPCTVDLRLPKLSRLSLSGSVEDIDPVYLLPEDLAAASLQAQLAVLSNCQYSGSSASSFDLHSPFVHALLHAGADQVISSYWPVGDRRAGALMHTFYRQLKTSQNVSTALWKLKQAQLARRPDDRSLDWAAFQLFIQ